MKIKYGGERMSKKKILIGLACLLLIGGIIAVALLSGDTSEKELVKKPEETPTETLPLEAVEITVAQLYTEYNANEISADQKYLNKILRVSGKVDEIKRDFPTGKAAVLISDMLGGHTRIFMKCVFESEAEATSLTNGQKVTIEGKFVGSKLEAVMRLENCSLVK